MSLNKVEFSEVLTEETFAKIQDYQQIAVLVDENTRQHCYPLLQPLLPSHHVIEIASGEWNKNLETCGYIWQQLTQLGFNRKALLINLGGGVIGDMGGFCAATYKRGIDFIQMPTSLLAQVDASVGGKLGVDFLGFKNHIGIFRIPNLVLIHPAFILTLPERELRSGFAEVIKHALIAHRGHWDLLRRKSMQKQDWNKLIPHSVRIKSYVVEEDFEEKGLRKILNFGHTVGHALETFFLHQGENRLYHGEAIAIGMICEGYLSTLKAGLPKAEFEDFSQYILEIFGHRTLEIDDHEKLHQIIAQDKKNTSGKLNCSLLHTIGEAVFDKQVTWEEVRESLDYYQELVKATH